MRIGQTPHDAAVDAPVAEAEDSYCAAAVDAVLASYPDDDEL